MIWPIIAVFAGYAAVSLALTMTADSDWPGWAFIWAFGCLSVGVGMGTIIGFISAHGGF